LKDEHGKFTGGHFDLLSPMGTGMEEGYAAIKLPQFAPTSFVEYAKTHPSAKDWGWRALFLESPTKTLQESGG